MTFKLEKKITIAFPVFRYHLYSKIIAQGGSEALRDGPALGFHQA